MLGSTLEPKPESMSCPNAVPEKQPILGDHWSRQVPDTQSPRATGWHAGRQILGSTAKHPTDSPPQLWSYTGFSLPFTPYLSGLCGPVPATLGRPLEHAVKGPKPVPGQQDVGQPGFYETLRDLENTRARSSGALRLVQQPNSRDRTNCYPPNGMVRRLRPRRGQVGPRLPRWGTEGAS